MVLSKEKAKLRCNELPDLGWQVYEYRPGNRSAPEWIVDQIACVHRFSLWIRQRPNDPNREHDPE